MFAGVGYYCQLETRLIKKQSLPCFNLISTDKEFVCLNSKSEDNSINQIELFTFLHSIIDGKIKFAEQAEINKVELCFYKNRCWKCHKENDVYFVNRLFSQKGVVIDGQNLMIDEDLTFNPSIIKGFQRYIQEHPSETFIMGEIKPRYSKTIGETYPSFGCAQCDSIFGELLSSREYDRTYVLHRQFTQSYYHSR